MAKARIIIKRRKAVRNIKKITKVMQMIATSRYQKAYKRAVGTKPYVKKIGELVASAVQAVRASAENPSTIRCSKSPPPASAKDRRAGHHLQPRPRRRLQRQRPSPRQPHPQGTRSPRRNPRTLRLRQKRHRLLQIPPTPRSPKPSPPSATIPNSPRSTSSLKNS